MRSSEKGLQLVAVGVAPAQDRVDARRDLGERERLGDVIVGAQFEADDAVDEVDGAGEHDDADIPLLPDAPGDAEAVFAWQADIEDEQIRRRHVDQPVERGSIGGKAHFMPGDRQIVGQHRAQSCVVIHHYEVSHWAPEPGKGLYIRTIILRRLTNCNLLGNAEHDACPNEGGTGCWGRPGAPFSATSE